MKGDSGDEEFNNRKQEALKSFNSFVKEAYASGKASIQVVDSPKKQRKIEQKRIKKTIKKRNETGNYRAAAMRKLYDKLGYKGNPGDHDLDEGVIGQIKTAVRRNWPNRLERTAKKATEIALKRKSPTSVKRALNLKAEVEAKRDGPDKVERVQRYLEPASSLAE